MELNPLATLLPEKKSWFTLRGSWSGYFGEDIGVLFLSRFEAKIFLFGALTMSLPRFEPQIFQLMS